MSKILTLLKWATPPLCKIKVCSIVSKYLNVLRTSLRELLVLVRRRPALIFAATSQTEDDKHIDCEMQLLHVRGWHKKTIAIYEVTL